MLGTPKSHHSRTVPLPRFLAAGLADFTHARKADDLAFTTAAGAVLRLSNWRRAVFLPAREQLAISSRFRTHDLRHTAAALMIQAGYPPKRLQEILGHASITTTLDLYGHLYPGCHPLPELLSARYRNRVHKVSPRNQNPGVVELRGLEPLAFWLQTRRSSS